MIKIAKVTVEVDSIERSFFMSLDTLSKGLDESETFNNIIRDAKSGEETTIKKSLLPS